MKIKKIVPAALFLAGSFLLIMNSSCSSSRKADSDQTEMSKKVEAFKKEWNKKLDKLDAKISRDEEKAGRTVGENKEKLNDEINDLKSKRQELQEEVNAAGDKTAAQWEDFKQDVSEKYQSLRDKVKSVFQSE